MVVCADNNLLFTYYCVICEGDMEMSYDTSWTLHMLTIIHPFFHLNDCNIILSIFFHRGRYTDKQLIRLQETPDEIPAGEF